MAKRHFESQSEVNKEARKERHYKLFYQNRLSRSVKAIKESLFFLYRFKKAAPQISNDEIAIVVHYRVFFKRSVLLVLAFLLINSFNVGRAYTYYEEPEGYWGFEDNDNIANFYNAGFVADDEGYLLKSVPVIEENPTYLNRQELIATHEVQENQTLSQIAAMYGLEVRTILWANNLANPNLLKIGAKLKIPKTDGIVHYVASGDTVERLAQLYKIDPAKIRQENTIKNDIIQIGQALVLPGAKPITVIKKAPVYIAKANSPTSTGKSTSTAKNKPGSSSKIIPKSEAQIASGGKMTFPTVGEITQGFYRSHLGVDIGNRSRPGVWAARSGTVVKVCTDWCGGYGRSIILDHGGGLKTLYAHLNQIYVNLGQEVNEGQVIGQMGNTGRVYGPTGIHLHFEVHLNNRRVSPWKYL